MKLRVLRKHYSHFITLLSLAGFMLLCFSNCQPIQLVPVEIESYKVIRFEESFADP